MYFVAPQHVGSSWIRDRTHVPCIGRWILNHRAPRTAFYLPVGRGGWGEGTPLPSKGVTGRGEPHGLAHPVRHTFSGEAEECGLFSG